MKFFKLFAYLLVFYLLFPNGVRANDAVFIPLKTGNWWLYRVSHAYSKDEAVVKESDTVKAEILNVAKYKDITVALFSNIPGGFFDGKATLIVVNDKDYYRAGEDMYDLIVKNKGEIKIDGYDILAADSPDNIKLGEIRWQELSLPLTKNKLFYCDETGKSRGDNYYCNWVRSVKPAKQEYFPGKDEYEIAQYTLPDESHSYYVKGVGLTYFSYSHHGSLDEKRWNLQKYCVR
jgi:hypothetical protein